MLILIFIILFLFIGIVLGFVDKKGVVSIISIPVISLLWSIVFGPWAIATFIELVLGFLIAKIIIKSNDERNSTALIDELKKIITNCYEEGLKYHYGNGVEKDYERAIKLYKRAADVGGHIEAKKQLELLLEEIKYQKKYQKIKDALDITKDLEKISL